MINKLGWGIFVGCAAAWLLVSCSPKLPATREDRLKWNLSALTNSYAIAGHENPKWDEDAHEALTEFARAQSASEDEASVFFDLAVSWSQGFGAHGGHRGEANQVTIR